MMRKNLIAFMIVGLMVFASSTANAQVFASFVDESPTSWTGFYGGINIGHGWGDIDDSLECPGINDIRDDLNAGSLDDTLFGSITFNTHVGGTQSTNCSNTDQRPDPNNLFPFSIPQAITAFDRNGFPTPFGGDGWTNDNLDQNVDGWSGGVQAGFLYQVSRIVFGLEVSGSVTNMSDTGVVQAIVPAAVIGLGGICDGFDPCVYEWKTDINSIYTSVARAGFAITNDILLSVKGGLAFAQIDFEAAGDKDSNTVEGWTVGGQADIMLTKNTSFFVSYDHMAFEDVKFRTQQDFLLFHNTTYHEYDYDIDQVKFGFNYHFK
ncbi:MAG: outer membrane protein [Nitrospinales bacterium]